MYVNRAQLQPYFTDAFLAQALDDNMDGVEDAGLLDSILDSASIEVDGILGTAFTTPFEPPYPPVVVSAALVFACDLLYARRMGKSGKADNPWAARAEAMRQRLADIVAGKYPLRAAAASRGGSMTLPSTDFLPRQQGGI